MLRHRRHESAVVTFQSAMRFVMGKGNGTIAALELFTAGTAQDDWRISAAIEQYHGLLVSLKAQPDLFDELARDDLLVAGFLKLLPHVDEFHFRQRPLLDPIGHFDECVAMLLRIEI